MRARNRLSHTPELSTTHTHTMKSHPSYFRIAFACVRLRPERRATFLEPPLGLGEQAQWVERAPRPSQIVSEKDFLSDGGMDTSGEMTTAASPTACVGLRPMRLATSAKHGMRMAVMKP